MKTLTQVKDLALVRQDLSNKAILPSLETEVAQMMAIKEAFDKEWKATWKALETFMIENDVKNAYNLTIAEKKAWKVTGTLPPRFYKQVLDTSELNHLFSKGKKLPKNASFTMTKYLTKTNRKVEVAA